MNAGLLKAIAVLTPLIRSYVVEAEATGATGAKKKQAVKDALEASWTALQSQIKELRPYNFSDFEPYVDIAVDGLVSLLNSLFGRIWKFVSDKIIDPVEGWVGVDIDKDGDIAGEAVILKPVVED